MDRRTHPPAAPAAREPAPLTIFPVALRCSGGLVEGYTEELAEDAIQVQSLGEMPVLGEAGEVTFYLAAGEVRARARVAALDPTAKTFRLELKHLDRNGQLLLAAVLRRVSGE